MIQKSQLASKIVMAITNSISDPDLSVWVRNCQIQAAEKIIAGFQACVGYYQQYLGSGLVCPGLKF